MRGIQRYSRTRRGMKKDESGFYVRFVDHQNEVSRFFSEDPDAEIARLRADLRDYQMAAAAEADEVDKRALTIKELRAEVDAVRARQKLVGYRWRHSAGEKWQYSDIPCGWEYEPLYAAMGADA